MLVSVLAVTAVAAGSAFFWRLDLALYDASLPRRPAAPEIVIVAVDDASIAELGRWPWRRILHAALLDRLAAAGAKAVALDFLFTEAESSFPDDDAALAAAMRLGPKTVLPLLVEMPQPGRSMRERLPIALLAQSAAAIGHANLEIDRDGIVRGVFLREGLGRPNWPYFPAALLAVAAPDAALELHGERHPDLAHAAPVWVRDFRQLIPYAGPPGHFTQLSYVDVLRGTAPTDALAGKIVLVGATAQGVGDAYATPTSGEGRAMAGVEVAANVLQGLREGRLLRAVPTPLATLTALLPVLIAAAALLWARPSRSLLAVAAIWVGTLASSVLLLRAGGWWWPPSASLAALLIMVPVWNWRRLEAAQAFLEAEFQLLAAERLPLFASLRAPRTALRPIDFVERRIELLRQATQRLRSVRRLFSDTINGLPDATLLADAAGRIVLANPAAATLFGAGAAASLEDTTVDAQLLRQVGDESVRFAQLAARAPCTVEAQLESLGRTVLIRSVPFCDAAGIRLGTIFALADITLLRAAQRERDDVLRFLSHDMKSPASSLLGLAQLQSDPERALPPRELSLRLDHLAQRLLTLVDGFVALARAESVDPRAFEDFDLRDALQDAYDEVWATAQARGNAISLTVPDDALLVHGDRHLLARMIVNLLTNAVKFSPAGAAVSLSAVQNERETILEVSDLGPGIAPERTAGLFRRFSRGLHRGPQDPGGAGLGLAFVRVVAEKHGGRAWAANNPDQGAVFRCALPR